MNRDSSKMAVPFCCTSVMAYAYRCFVANGLIKEYQMQGMTMTPIADIVAHYKWHSGGQWKKKLKACEVEE